MDIDGKPAVREKWANKAECILSLIGISVGLGNIWRLVN
jgi:SNF family Na+-dependent transporter